MELGYSGLALDVALETMRPNVRKVIELLARLRHEIQCASHIGVENTEERYRSFPSAGRLLKGIWDLQQEKAFRLSLDKLPILSIPDRSMQTRGFHASFDHTRNVIHIPEDGWTGTSDGPQLGDKIGEELFGHCYRFHRLYLYGGKPDGTFPLGGKVERGDVEEFYGFLGRKFLHRLLQEQGCELLLFPTGAVTPPKNVRVQNEVDAHRAKMQWSLIPPEETPAERMTNEGHRIGYAWANTFDTGAIPWEGIPALYSLSADEVVTRFFRHK